MPLRPQLEAIKAEADQTRAKATEVLPKLTGEQLTWTPDKDRWTIAQILDHLNTVHRMLIPRFEEALKDAPAAEPGSNELVKPGFMDRMLIRVTSPSSPVKIPVPPMFLPEESPDPKTAVGDFFRLHDRLIGLLVQADGFRLKGVIVTSPVSDRLRVGCVTYFEANFGHELYHWNQVEALTATAGFPK